MVLNELIENRYRTLAAYLVLVTLRDVYEIAGYRTHKKYSRDFKSRFGFGPKGDVEIKYQRVADRLDEWIGSDDFFVILTKLELEPANVKALLRDLLEGNRREEFEPFFAQVQDQLHRYVWDERKNKKQKRVAAPCLVA